MGGQVLRLEKGRRNLIKEGSPGLEERGKVGTHSPLLVGLLSATLETLGKEVSLASLTPARF
jgi:hypothetical protein